MGKHVAPEKFVVGETVQFCSGEYVSSVTVFAVNGDAVTAGSFPNLAQTYVPRADGKHVRVGTPDFAVMPDIIFHKPQEKPVEPKVSLWKRITGTATA